MKANGDGPNGQDDNCKCEFDYALRRQGVKKMITVVMDPACRDTTTWTGSVGAKLGGLLYINLCNDSKFQEAVRQLRDEIKEKRAIQHV